MGVNCTWVCQRAWAWWYCVDEGINRSSGGECQTHLSCQLTPRLLGFVALREILETVRRWIHIGYLQVSWFSTLHAWFRIVETVYRSPGQRRPFVRTQRSLAMEKPIHDCQRDWATCRGESLEKARFCSEEQCSVELDLSAWWSLSWWNWLAYS